MGLVLNDPFDKFNHDLIYSITQFPFPLNMYMFNKFHKGILKVNVPQDIPILPTNYYEFSESDSFDHGKKNVYCSANTRVNINISIVGDDFNEERFHLTMFRNRTRVIDFISLLEGDINKQLSFNLPKGDYFLYTNIDLTETQGNISVFYN